MGIFKGLPEEEGATRRLRGRRGLPEEEAKESTEAHVEEGSVAKLPEEGGRGWGLGAMGR